VFGFKDNITDGQLQTVWRKVIDMLELSSQVGQKTWDTRKVDNGVYFYTLSSNGMTSTGKIIISK